VEQPGSVRAEQKLSGYIVVRLDHAWLGGSLPVEHWETDWSGESVGSHCVSALGEGLLFGVFYHASE
jgi:hypothetical protein